MGSGRVFLYDNRVLPLSLNQLREVSYVCISNWHFFELPWLNLSSTNNLIIFFSSQSLNLSSIFFLLRGWRACQLQTTTLSPSSVKKWDYKSDTNPHHCLSQSKRKMSNIRFRIDVFLWLWCVHLGVCLGWGVGNFLLIFLYPFIAGVLYMHMCFYVHYAHIAIPTVLPVCSTLADSVDREQKGTQPSSPNE